MVRIKEDYMDNAERPDDQRPAAVPVAEGAVTAPNDDSDAEAVDAASPYAEFGGLRQNLQERRETAAKRRDEALSRWQDRIKEGDEAILSFAERLKPDDTERQQRRLRRLAVGQSLGELVSKLFEGGIAFGRRGQGYVTAPTSSLARNALDRAEKLRQQGVLADREYRNRMQNILSNRARQGEHEAMLAYKNAEDEVARLDKMENYRLQQLIRNYFSADQENLRQKGREALETARQNNRVELEKQRSAGRASLKRKGGAGGSADPDADDIARLKMLYLPKEKTTTVNTARGTRTTTAPYTSYSKQQDADAEAWARQVLPIRRRYNLSDADIKSLQKAIDDAPEMGVTWQKIGAALAGGYGVDDIVLHIYDRNR